jgi:hypothetical protein
MFRRYHHGHSAALGFLLALALERHALVFALLVFCAGLVAGRMWLVWLRVGEAARAYFQRKTAAVKPRRANGLAQTDEIPY